jgi:glutaredoxin
LPKLLLNIAIWGIQMKSKTLILSLAAIVTALTTVAYAQQQAASDISAKNSQKLESTDAVISQKPNAPVNQPSNASAIALAQHLKQRGAKMYGAFWCPYCHRQKDMFGAEAFSLIEYVECDPRGENAQPDLCRRANITGFPTWEINGRQYRGMQSLEQLAEFSGYQGSRNFGTEQ